MTRKQKSVLKPKTCQYFAR